jgi:putative tryptophan/tyrosine transport system substrate-binding protein
MKRREFITLLSGASTWPLAARAQQPERIRRVGVLMSLAEHDPEEELRYAAFVEELQKLGWTDGRNVRIDIRWAAGNASDAPKLAAELIALAPDVILVSGGSSVVAILPASTIAAVPRRCAPQWRRPSFVQPIRPAVSLW